MNSPFKARVLADESVQLALEAAQAAHQIFIHELEILSPTLYPRQRAERLQAALSHMETPDEIRKTQDEIAAARSDAAQSSARQGAILASRHAAIFDKTLHPLIKAAEAIVDQIGLEIFEAEKQFHEKFNVASEPTAVARSLVPLKKQISHFRSQLSPTSQQVLIGAPQKSHRQEILDWFH